MSLRDGFVEADAARAFEVLRQGGIAILPMDIGYSLIGGSPDALRKIFDAKGRAPTKLNAMVGNADIAREIYRMSPRAWEVLEVLTESYDLPLGAIAPCRMEHAFFADMDDHTRAMSTKDGTAVLLMNAGPFHAAISRLSFVHGHPLIGSSANLSNQGTKFRVRDIEPSIRSIADVIVDQGLRRYHLYRASSTLLNLETFEVVRHGACFEVIADVVARHFKVELPPPPPESPVFEAWNAVR